MKRPLSPVEPSYVLPINIGLFSSFNPLAVTGLIDLERLSILVIKSKGLPFLYILTPLAFPVPS